MSQVYWGFARIKGGKAHLFQFPKEGRKMNWSYCHQAQIKNQREVNTTIKERCKNCLRMIEDCRR